MNKLPWLCALTLALAGCSSNDVEKLTPKSSVVKHASTAGYEDRYTNLYRDIKDYPITCDAHCYPPTKEIACKADMEDCQYTGPHPQLFLNTGFNVQWYGHASFKITTENGQQFLFDPVSEQFDWPVNWAFRLKEGFNRQPPASLTALELQKTDAVMYSHIHYDHFNKDDIATIGSQTQYLAPLGFAEHFPNNGYKVTEMAWYASKQVGEVTAHFVPAHHFSNRLWVPFLYEDNNATLWGGWVLEYQGKKLFFAGDTGYSPHFKDIAAKYGNMDICLLPIASYFSEQYPDWYRQVHTTPEDALTAANELGCKTMIPWGYGNSSWKMGDRTSHSALFRLLHMYKKMDSKVPLHVMNEGESIQF